MRTIIANLLKKVTELLEFFIALMLSVGIILLLSASCSFPDLYSESGGLAKLRRSSGALL